MTNFSIPQNCVSVSPFDMTNPGYRMPKDGPAEHRQLDIFFAPEFPLPAYRHEQQSLRSYRNSSPGCRQ